MDLFDLIGPVMVGPSSSHTAGAARIGQTARLLLGEEVVAADVGLHGSFAKTYHGHGTDRAIARSGASASPSIPPRSGTRTPTRCGCPSTGRTGAPSRWRLRPWAGAASA